MAPDAAVAAVAVGGEKMSAVDAMRTLRADAEAVGWRGGVLGGMDRMAMGRMGPPGVIMVLDKAAVGAGTGAGAAPGCAITCMGGRDAGAGDGAKTESENAATGDQRDKRMTPRGNHMSKNHSNLANQQKRPKKHGRSQKKIRIKDTYQSHQPRP